MTELLQKWRIGGRSTRPSTGRFAPGIAMGAVWVVLLALWATALMPVPALAQRPSEYQVKAAFIYNFPNFVDWPEGALPDTTTALTIGILGKDPFGDAFAPFLSRAVKGRKGIIRRSTRLQELPFCHILFICESEKKYLPQILEHFRGRPVLTVGETEGFAQTGVMINLVLKGNKVGFEVNVDAVEQARLKLSAKLLDLATIVKEPQE
jgi:hypothetical protein